LSEAPNFILFCYCSVVQHLCHSVLGVVGKGMPSRPGKKKIVTCDTFVDKYFIAR